MSIKELEAKAKELREMQIMQEELQGEIDALKDVIKAALGEREEATAGAYKITYKAVTSTRVDTASLKKELPEIAARFSKASTCRRLLVV